jgi:hypothetical protein
MSDDPEPLLRGEGTAFERQLLDAAARERPSAEMLGSIQQALGIGASAAKAGAGAGGSLVAYVAAAVLGVGGAVFGLASLREPARPPAPAAIVQRTLPAELPAAPPAPTPSSAAPALGAAGRGNAPALAAPAPPKRVTTTDDLRDQIRLVDEARAALRSGATERAAGLLERYLQRFPRGAFRQEVAVLRVEALERQGERRRASALAREFLEQHPQSPHSERVGRVLDPREK